MQIATISINIEEYKPSELTAEETKLIHAAQEASQSAYAPYSGFKVGAALLMADGSIITGSNQENASSPVGTCAERTALNWAGANFPGVAVKMIAISASDQSGNHAANLSPCGMCRQSLLEVQQRFLTPIRILLDGPEVIKVVKSANELLPLSFDQDSLNSK